MYKSCFDGILSCLNGSSLLSTCFYPPSPSDSSHEIVITDEQAKADELAKALAKIESQWRCFNAKDTKDYQIAITMDPDKRGELRVFSYYDEFCTNDTKDKKKKPDDKKIDEFGFMLAELPLPLNNYDAFYINMNSEEKDKSGSMLAESPLSLIVDVPDPEVAVERVDHIVVSGKEERVSIV